MPKSTSTLSCLMWIRHLCALDRGGWWRLFILQISKARREGRDLWGNCCASHPATWPCLQIFIGATGSAWRCTPPRISTGWSRSSECLPSRIDSWYDTSTPHPSQPSSFNENCLTAQCNTGCQRRGEVPSRVSGPGLGGVETARGQTYEHPATYPQAPERCASRF
jgi:hypothetical protein